MPSNYNQHYVSNQQRKPRTKRIIFEALLSAIIIILAVLVCIYREELFKYILLSRIKFQPGSQAFEKWIDPPISTTRNYYLFNITNPIEIVTNPKTATIKFKDTPPYSYNIKTKKTNIQWLNNNKELSYAVERLFTRDPTRFDPLSLNDTGYFLDFVRAIVRTHFESKATEVFYAATGYDTFYYENAVGQLEGFTSLAFNATRDQIVGGKTDMAGFIYLQNDTRLYNVSIRTDPMTKGELLTFDSTLVPFNILSPSYYPFPIYDGLTYPAMLSNKPTLNIFVSDFCTPILLEYNRSLTMFEGINMHEYIVKLIDINNCTNPNDTRTCNQVDKLDVSKCLLDSLPENTIFLSKPHFYGTNNETINEMNVEGFTPTSDKHESVLYFEPYTGTPFKASYRMQLNIEATIDPMKESEDGLELVPINSKKGVKRSIPILWVGEEVNILEKVIDDFRKAFLIRQYLHYYIVIPSAIVLAIIIVVIIELVAKCNAKNGQDKRGAYSKTEVYVQH